MKWGSKYVLAILGLLNLSFLLLWANGRKTEYETKQALSSLSEFNKPILQGFSKACEFSSCKWRTEEHSIPNHLHEQLMAAIQALESAKPGSGFDARPLLDSFDWKRKELEKLRFSMSALSDFENDSVFQAFLALGKVQDAELSFFLREVLLFKIIRAKHSITTGAICHFGDPNIAVSGIHDYYHLGDSLNVELFPYEEMFSCSHPRVQSITIQDSVYTHSDSFEFQIRHPVSPNTESDDVSVKAVFKRVEDEFELERTYDVGITKR